MRFLIASHIADIVTHDTRKFRSSHQRRSIATYSSSILISTCNPLAEHGRDELPEK